MFLRGQSLFSMREMKITALYWCFTKTERENTTSAIAVVKKKIYPVPFNLYGKRRRMGLSIFSKRREVITTVIKILTLYPVVVIFI